MWPFGKKVWKPWSTTRKTDPVVATYIAEGVTVLCWCAGVVGHFATVG